MRKIEQSLFDIADSIRLICEYAENWESFRQSVRDQDAVIRRLIIIGEATKRLPREFRDAYPDIPWKEMAGLRDVVVHNYDEIDLDRLRPVIEVELPKVLCQIEPLLPAPPEHP